MRRYVVLGAMTFGPSFTMACQLLVGIHDTVDVASAEDSAAPAPTDARVDGVDVSQSTDAVNEMPAADAAPDDVGAEATIPWNCAASSYMGQQYWTCSPVDGNLHECAGGVPKVEGCGGLGCKGNANGINDQCYLPSPGWACASSRGTDGNQYLTCSADGNIHMCEGATPVEILCAAGCNHNAVNNNDTCK